MANHQYPEGLGREESKRELFVISQCRCGRMNGKKSIFEYFQVGKTMGVILSFGVRNRVREVVESHLGASEYSKP